MPEHSPEENQNEAPGTPPSGKTFSEDYVSSLRNESAGYRNAAKTYETALRKVLGVKDGDELGNLDARLAAYQQGLEKQQSDTLKAANKRLISAELRALGGYDCKLLEKLIDLSNVKVDENGTVTGLKEAAENAAKEYPAVRKAVPPFSRGTKGPVKDMDSGKDRANAALRAAFGKE